MEGSADVSVFKTCGVEIYLSHDQPEEINIIHYVPKGYYDLSKERTESKCDLIIVIGEKELYAHTDVLSSRIPFFAGLFNSNMTECEKKKIEMASIFHGFPTIVESLINYAYTGNLTISITHVQHMMMGAVYLNMEFVIDECARFMRRRINIHNAFDLLFFCRSFAFHTIDSFILQCIDNNFVPISQTSEFLDLPVEELDALLRRDSLNVDDEGQVFEAISRWIGHIADRKKEGARLLKCVRCTRLSETFIEETVEKTDWVMNDPDCITVIFEATEIIKSKENSHLKHSFNSSKRCCDTAYRPIIAMCTILDKSTGQHHCPTYLYDPISDVWTKSPAHIRPVNDTIALADHKIYFFGNGTNKPKVFDTVSNKLTPTAEIPQRKWNAATGFIDRFLYIAGGCDDRSAFNSMESFCSATQVWTTLSPMSVQRYRSAACVYDGKLYVIGGRKPHEVWQDGECYDPKSDIWTPISPMNYKRSGPGAAILNGKIYVAGGSDGSVCLCTMECYDPNTNTWTTRKSMRNRRFSFKLISSCGKLFAIGGHDDVSMDSDVISSVEMYDPETDTWEDRVPISEKNVIVAFIDSLPIPASILSSVVGIEASFVFSRFASSHSSGFRCFNLKDELLNAITDCGYKHPSKIQHELLPQALNGMNLNCHAKTGVGKTTLFVISTLQLLEPMDGEVSVLVLCGTHDVATEITEEYEKLAKGLTTVKVSTFSGESRTKKSRSTLRKSCPHIAIGTPGRIQYLAKTGVLKLNNVKHLVLDECDTMLGNSDMRADIQKIVKFMPKEKQVMMFSNSLSNEAHKNCEQFLRKTTHAAE